MYRILFASLLLVLTHPASAQADGPVKALILTGQSTKHHNWKAMSAVVRSHLEDAAIFDIHQITTPAIGESMEGFAPEWTDYEVVVLDYAGTYWPEKTQDAFEEYMKSGGGLVVIHSTNNAFTYWPEFNEMIGLGGWGAAVHFDPPIFPDDPSKQRPRNEEWGPRVYWDNCSAVHDHSPGAATHPPRHDFLMTNRNPSHPIMSGLPEIWLHGADELYSNLRGPAKNLTVLATGIADPTQRRASPYHEPLLFTVDYGEGRVFHTTLGHIGARQDANVLPTRNIGFKVTLQRGTEWAARGTVSQPVPDLFPSPYEATYSPQITGEWQSLIDPELSQWEVFLKTPDGETDLVDGSSQNVFSVAPDSKTLHVSGESFGALTSRLPYENYHLQSKIRWNEKQWGTHQGKPRDSGILYHCYGPHGAIFGTWKRSLEFQIRENGVGDLVTLGKTRVEAPFSATGKAVAYQPGGNYAPFSGYLRATGVAANPLSEWSTLDIYVFGDRAIHLVDGQIVMALREATDHDGKPLSAGQIQIQSMGSSATFKDLRIRPIEALPRLLAAKAQLL